MDQRELDHMLLDLLPPEGRDTLEEVVDEFLREEAIGPEPVRLIAAARMFAQKSNDDELPIDQQLVAHQMAAALRLRADGLLN
jgi:hypothetical protein